jgi:hypothetical protein
VQRDQRGTDDDDESIVRLIMGGLARWMAGGGGGGPLCSLAPCGAAAMQASRRFSAMACNGEPARGRVRVQ